MFILMRINWLLITLLIAAPACATVNTLQDFEDGVLWEPGDGDDSEGYNRGWAFTDSGTGTISIANIGANGTSHSLQVTFGSGQDQIYFRSTDRSTDHMPEADGADRVSFYVKFPANFPVQTSAYPYRTWQFGTYIHDPSDFTDTDLIRHFYHHANMEFVTAEGTGNGWVKYIFDLQPDQEVNETGTPEPLSHYFDEFGRFYWEFGSDAGGPSPTYPFTIYIDEIKFYTADEDGEFDEIHTGGSADAGMDGDYQVRVGASGEDFTNLNDAINDIPGSGTIVVTDGSYSTANDTITTNLPPDGVDGDHTRIIAENEGNAIFPNSFLQIGSTISNAYIDYVGLASYDSVSTLSSDHVRFFRVSAYIPNNDYNSGAVFSVGIYSTNVLLEDCWAYGAGRYKFLIGGATAELSTHDIVLRRCIARNDVAYTGSDEPMALFSMYAAYNVIMENCIGIDGDHDEFWVEFLERAGMCYVHHGSYNISMVGSILLNHKTPLTSGLFGSGSAFDFHDNIAWDTAMGYHLYDADIPVAVYSNTLGSSVGTSALVPPPAAQGIRGGGGSDTISVYNNIITGYSDEGVDGYEISSDYNSYYNNTADFTSSGGPAGANDYCTDNSNAINPTAASLLYLPRIESGSALSGAGSGGSDIGATILYRIGKSGTLYGDTDYDTVTSEELWPWPYEERIKSTFASYSCTDCNTYGGGTDTLSGARGFAASGTQLNGTDDITLTSYIWEYLGNQMPADIYDTTFTPATTTTLYNGLWSSPSNGQVWGPPTE